MKGRINLRYVDLEGTYNFRDIGGYKTASGKTVKYGKIYRSDALSNLTKEDIEKFKELNINTIIDYRSEKEIVENPNVFIEGVKTFNLDPKADVAALASSEFEEGTNLDDMSNNLTPEFVKKLMTQQNVQFVINDDSIKAFKNMFDVILDDSTTASVQHCRGGKDRTGFGIALILFALGVDEETILEDYMLTNHYKKDKNETSLAELLEETNNEDIVKAVRFFKEAQLSFIEAAFKTINEMYDNPLNYLKTVIGLTEEDFEKLHNMYLE